MHSVLKKDDTTGLPILVLGGKVKGEGNEELNKKLEEMDKLDHQTVVIDISNAEYIDSHGLGVIIYYHKSLQHEKRKLVLLNSNTDPESYMNRLIEITNLDKVLTVTETLDSKQ
ncbi:MAG: anti-sigma factor antagonist [Chitinivibrionales bacterium]|nr:anti-sigma factor antagonist [Chitinivibrionales bacterium]